MEQKDKEQFTDAKYALKKKELPFAIGEYRFEDALKEFMKNVDIKHYKPVEEENKKKIFILNNLNKLKRSEKNIKGHGPQIR